MRQSTSFVLGAMLAVTFGVGCGSSSNGGDAAADAGAPDAAGDATAQQQMLQALNSRAASLNVQCTSGAAAPSVTDISGTWAWMTVGTRRVSTLGMTFRTRAVSYLLATHTVTGGAVAVSATYCDRDEIDDETAPVKVVIPNAWRDTHTQIQRSGTWADDGTGALALTLPRFIELWGVNLANPETDPLPTAVNDPNLVDCDHDGNPGLSVGLTGFFNATMYVCQRQHSTMVGYAMSADRIEGKFGLESEQTILAPDTLKNTAQTTIPDPEACTSNFVMVRVAATETCDTLRAKGYALFQ